MLAPTTTGGVVIEVVQNGTFAGSLEFLIGKFSPREKPPGIISFQTQTVD
jgi:hypothetical protein